jgi:HD-like signal output (HDOD) protein/CheY-like chemotaxis protein
MSTILVIDDMAIFREPIAASLRLAGYTIFTAKDGADGLQQIRAHHPDLVLLDVSMPTLNGMSVLRLMQREPSLAHIPVILLTAEADKKVVLEAAKFGVRDYLLKTGFSLTELHERIKRLLAAKPATTTELLSDASPKDTPQAEPFILDTLAPLMNVQQCISRVEACMAGKTLSGAVAEVIMLAGRPSAEAKDLSALITRDPVLSVRVLHMANSAAFTSRRGTVTTITEAVRNIGATNVRSIAASVGIFDAMPASSTDGFNPIRCWQHSVAVAHLCEAFVSPAAPAEAGVAYLVGLCHDLGEIMFRTQFEQEYKLVLEAQQKSGAALEDITKHLLGMTQSDILKVLLKCMGLPDSIHNPIERFQKNTKAIGEPSIISHALAMAETYANGLLLASSESSLISPIAEKDWSALSGQTKLEAPDGKEIRLQVYCLTAILSRMNPTDQAALMKSPYKKSSAKVWLARDPLFSNADPLAEALGELADLELHDRLPTPAEVTNYSGLVIEARGRNIPGWSLPDIENSRNTNPQLPLLWLTSQAAATSGEQLFEPVQAVSLRAILAFIAQAAPSTLRSAA